MEPEPYAYQKLMADQYQIRVLHIRAATTWHEEISCHLTTVSLEDSPQFEALSYVWGDAKDTLSIQLKGGVFPVTRNLEAAMRRLRMKTEERVIWIDQLCINQADIVEKSIQVAIMPRIYKSCKEVISWLGEIEAVNEITVEDALTSETNVQGVAAAGMAIVQEFASEKHVHEISCFQLINESTIITSPDYVIRLEGLRLITNLPYWYRAWIVQENILPNKAIVVLGSCTLPWSSFLSAAKNLSKHTLDCCRLLSDSLPLDTKNTLLAFCARLIKVSDVASSRIDHRSSLFDLLRSTHARKASDDRDKVYSVLGLVTTWLAATSIVPDYTLTTLQLYSQVTEHIITSMSGSLFVLACNHLCRPGIPSWVHDWAGEDHTDYPYGTGWADMMWNMYNASSKVPATFKRHRDSILLVDGYYVDRIVATGDPMEVHDWKSSIPIWDSWTAMTGVDKDPHKPYVTGGDINNALWRCLVGNVAFTGQFSDPQAFPYGKLTQKHYSAYEAWKKEIRTAVEGQWMLSMETAAVSMVAAVTARHRRLFITEKGYLGMGALTTAVSDEVYVLLGSNVPFVTRTAAPPTDDGIEPLDLSIKTYTLIGECYLHGVMDGEILLDPKFRKETIALC